MAQPKENLAVWQRAMHMTTSVYRTTQTFPSSEIYGLTSQVRRAAVSVASNIAEGRGRLSGVEFRRFLGMAQGSNFEVQTQLLVAKALGFGVPEQLKESQLLSEEVGKMISSLIAKLPAKN
jgi:four helix bundle protein